MDALDHKMLLAEIDLGGFLVVPVPLRSLKAGQSTDTPQLNQSLKLMDELTREMLISQ